MGQCYLKLCVDEEDDNGVKIISNSYKFKDEDFLNARTHSD